MRNKRYKKKASKTYLIWITGVSGSGKSTIAKKIIKPLRKIIGPTALFNGDDLRKIFNLNSFEYPDRKKIAYSYSKLSNLLVNQGINVVFATVSMFDDVRNFNRKKNKNKYIEIYIKSPIKKIINNRKKKIYFSKKKLVGRDIRAEFPKNPDILINNNFEESLHKLSNSILLKIKKKLK